MALHCLDLGRAETRSQKLYVNRARAALPKIERLNITKIDNLD